MQRCNYCWKKGRCFYYYSCCFICISSVDFRCCSKHSILALGFFIFFLFFFVSLGISKNLSFSYGFPWFFTPNFDRRLPGIDTRLGYTTSSSESNGKWRRTITNHQVVMLMVSLKSLSLATAA